MEFHTHYRQKAVQETVSQYPAPIRAHCAHFTDHKSHFSKENSGYYLEATISAHEFLDTYKKLAESTNSVHQFCEGVEGIDAPRIDRHCHDDDRSFTGMTGKKYLSEIKGESHEIRDRFLRAQEELEKTGIRQAIEEGAAFKKKRRRVMSEHDGDYDLERKWDSHPFQHTEFARKEFPIVELIFPIVNSAGTSAAFISKFGARCLALADLLEKAGYRVAITAENWCQTMRPTKTCGRKLAKEAGLGDKEVYFAGQCVRYIVRSANDYGDVESMAVFGSTEFYRRSVFSLDYQLGHYIFGMDDATRSRKVDDGYGIPLYTRPIPLSQGQIFLDPAVMEQIFESNTVKAAEMFKERIMWQLRCEQATANQAS